MVLLPLAGLNLLNSEMGIVDIPLVKIIAVIVVITLAQVFRKLFASIIIGYFEDLTSKTESELVAGKLTPLVTVATSCKRIDCP